MKTMKCLVPFLLANMMAMAVQVGGRSTDPHMAEKLAQQNEKVSSTPKITKNNPVKGARRNRLRRLGKVNPKATKDKYDSAAATWSPPTGQTAQTPQSGNGGAGGFFGGSGTATTARKGGSGKGSNSSSKKGSRVVTTPINTASSASTTMNSATTETNALATFDNKCDAAAAGAEYKTSSFVPVYYQYEVLTTPTRNILNLVDIIDNAIQDFLAVWIVDCDTAELFDDDQVTQNFGGRRLESHRGDSLQKQVVPPSHRKLQMTLAPIVGTGVGEWDTVLLDGDHPCQSLVPEPALGQVCYKVIGSVNVYLDESMQVAPADIRTLVHQTAEVGINYAATDFSQLDPDIQGLFFFQGYDAAPEDLMNKNWEANKRAWDTSRSSNPFVAPSKKERSGGAKFGIAFATLLCIALAALVGVYLCKNRRKLMGDDDEEWTSCFCCPMGGRGVRDGPRRSPRKRSHNGDSDAAFYKRQQRKALGLYDEGNDDADEELSFAGTHATFGTISSSPANSDGMRTRSPETPPTNTSTVRETPTYLETERNIVTPTSDWDGRSTRSHHSDFSTDNYGFPIGATPDDRIRMSLSKDAIRGSSRRRSRTPSKHGEFLAPARSYECGDTVDL